ncbi:MAG: aminomethyl-transferring glycine dehydrogenase [Chitinophagales bacterium]|nr:aminomethyl-transferring glycine dehydrogenase [Bacteroidota bacterium]
MYIPFEQRHIGIAAEEEKTMLQSIGVKSVDALIKQTLPKEIYRKKPLHIGTALSEPEILAHLKQLGKKNQLMRSLIGLGYYGTYTPAVIQRNIFENPSWYTQYTPYQAEIAQGRLEALLNFQTVVADLCGLPVANASLLDEATAAAEAMLLLYHLRNKNPQQTEANVFWLADNCFPATQEVVCTRANAVGIDVKICPVKDIKPDSNTFGILLQYPAEDGNIENYAQLCQKTQAAGAFVAVAADLLALTILQAPGEWGADVVVGNSQRFGVPMGYGGPHAAFMATKDEYKRLIPGRIIGVSIDKHNNPALRMALQTREQHIRREKATSNICTAQALLAIMASMYAVYYGADGLKQIANTVHKYAKDFAEKLQNHGFKIVHTQFFDTVCIEIMPDTWQALRKNLEKNGFNIRFKSADTVCVAFDELTNTTEVDTLVHIFSNFAPKQKNVAKSIGINKSLLRKTPFLAHDVFKQYRTETELMRYIKQLEQKDLSLTHSMIPLGSCTMKLNAAVELLPVSWQTFNSLHPFAPLQQTKGYQILLDELAQYLCDITEFEACSLQPNSGAQGEYAGLLTISKYHAAHKQSQRNVALIPSSAHGTNPASAVMSGMKVVVVKCDEHGNIDVNDLQEKAKQYQDTLACLMVTYPSTHGVYETAIRKICDIVHQYGGLVYMDGANMNAQVGLSSPGAIGADVCHLNLHKTFAIPHGGGGPGMGPICVNKKLAPFLPSHGFLDKNLRKKRLGAVSGAPFGSANILLISYAYIKLLGSDGLQKASMYAILNANYLKSRLEKHYKILYTGPHGNVAHEFILDMRAYKNTADIEVEDIAKRLMDYGFHAPTVSFPVAGTLMIEPTESENKAELDRFCDALIAIKQEIEAIAEGKADAQNNVLKNAPHTLAICTANQWNYPYSREEAAFPLPFVRHHKFWASVGRINSSYGDRNLICTCPPLASYSEEEIKV